MAKAVKKAPTKKEISDNRIENLTNAIYDTIEKTGKLVPGQLTTTEVLNALLRIAHSYNSMHLDHEIAQSVLKGSRKKR